MEVILIQFAAVGFQLRDDVFLRAVNSVGSRWSWAEAHQFRHVLVRLRTVEPAGMVGRRRDFR